MARGVGVGDYCKHFGLRRRLFEGRLLFEDCFVSESWLSMIILSHSNCPEGYLMDGEVLLLFVGMIGRVKR